MINIQLKQNLINYRLVGSFLLILIVLDACLSGGGRIINFGAISIRMILFAFGLVYVGYGLVVYKKTIYSPFAKLTIVFILTTLVSVAIGIKSDTPIYSILNELKPKIYFLSLLFFSIAIRDQTHIRVISRIIEASALAISIVFIATFSAWKLDILNYEILHSFLNPHDDPSREFIFRNEITFYFKSLIYVAVGVFFFLKEDNQLKKLFYVLLLLLAVGLTMTRGVWLAVFLTLAIHAFTTLKSWHMKISYSLASVLLGALFVFFVASILPASHISDSDKLNDLTFLINITKNNFTTFQYLFGAGAGYVTPNPIEITYLDIFFKFGIVGICFWLFPLFFIISKVKSITYENMVIAMPYILSSIFVYIVSFTNSFLTNPIGMALVLITMVTVERLSHRDA